MDLNFLIAALRENSPQRLRLPNYTASAVLLPLIRKGAELEVVLTLRSEKVLHHKRQISYPGGMREPLDRSLQQTACRETEEELGIPRRAIRILGALDETLTPARYRIAPFVGLLDSRDFRPNPHEIDEVILVPLKHFLNPRTLKLQDNEFFGPEFSLPFFRYRNHVIWGATGRITLNFLKILRSAQSSS